MILLSPITRDKIDKEQKHDAAWEPENRTLDGDPTEPPKPPKRGPK